MPNKRVCDENHLHRSLPDPWHTRLACRSSDRVRGTKPIQTRFSGASIHAGPQDRAARRSAVGFFLVLLDVVFTAAFSPSIAATYHLTIQQLAIALPVRRSGWRLVDRAFGWRGRSDLAQPRSFSRPLRVRIADSVWFQPAFTTSYESIVRIRCASAPEPRSPSKVLFVVGMTWRNGSVSTRWAPPRASMPASVVRLQLRPCRASSAPHQSSCA